jgi:hypothetical protein
VSPGSSLDLVPAPLRVGMIVGPVQGMSYGGLPQPVPVDLDQG